MMSRICSEGSVWNVFPNVLRAMATSDSNFNIIGTIGCWIMFLAVVNNFSSGVQPLEDGAELEGMKE